MRIVKSVILAAVLLSSSALSAQDVTSSAAIVDPPRDQAHPAKNRSFLLPSHGEGLNALFLLAAGEGPKPTLILLHGLPGHERNLDLAQAARRAGWNVLTFTYRGAWGSSGRFSIANAIEDAQTAVAFVRSPEAARAYNIDTTRIVIAGHSMGGLAAAMEAAGDSDLSGLILIDAWNAGVNAAEIKAGGDKARTDFITSLGLGNAVQGATATGLTDEFLAKGQEWDLLRYTPRLARHPMLNIYATHGNAADNRALAAAVSAINPKGVEAIELDSDHSFTDHRIALSTAIVRWLQALPERP